MQKNRFRNFWIIIATAFIVVVLLFAAWLITMEVTAQDLYETYNNQQLALVTGAANGIEGLFVDLGTSLYTLSSRQGIQDFDATSTRAELSKISADLSTLGVLDIGILDSNGTARFFAVDHEQEGINFAWRSYFKAFQESSLDKTLDVVVELLNINPGERGFTIAIPILKTDSGSSAITEEGEFLGVIQASLTLDTLVNRYIAPFKPTNEGHINLLSQDFDLIWSSDPHIGQINLSGSRQSALEEMIDRVLSWQDDAVEGGSYIYTPPRRRESVELIAYFPLTIGRERMVIFVKTPASVARQTSLSAFRGQQLVFTLSILTVLVGILLGGWILMRESRQRLVAEEALRKSEMAEAVLKERNRLAGDLHDSVTQGLYGILLHADAALGQISAGDIEKAVEYLQDIKETGKEGLAEMRLLIFELRPPVLEKEGLESALEARLYAVEKRVGLKAEITSNIGKRIPRDIEEVFYRIAQEALNNILKHAQAKNVRINLLQRDQKYSMEISDDGVGFNRAFLSKNIGMGLANMEERSQRIEGDFRVESQPGNGTRVFVEVTQ